MKPAQDQTRERQLLRVVERVADGNSHFALREMARLLLLQPCAQALHRGSALLLAQGKVLSAADNAELLGLSFDDEQLGVEIDRALRFWCIAERFTEFASGVCVASSTVTAIGLGDDVVAGIPIDDEHALRTA